MGGTHQHLGTTIDRPQLRMQIVTGEAACRPKKKRRAVKRVKELIVGDSDDGEALWRDADVLLELCEPVLQVLRMCDGAEPCAGEVYHAMYVLEQLMGEADLGGEELTGERRAAVAQIAADRWEFLHHDLYGAAYAFNPRFIDHKVSDNVEVGNSCSLLFCALSLCILMYLLV